MMIRLLLFILLPNLLFAQSDSLKGKVKTVREKLIFMDSIRQNTKLFSTEGEYGHHGFIRPEFTFSRFNSWWFHTPLVHYLNYKREYNADMKLVNETWYYKNDEVLERYVYTYDAKQNRIQKKNINNDGTYTVRNYYYGYSDVVTSQLYYKSDDPGSFSYSNFIYDEKKKLIEVKNFDEQGEGYSMRYEYATNGEKTKEISHSPYVWQKMEDNSSVQRRDKQGTDYLKREYFYDDKLNVIKEQYYTEDFHDKNKAALSNIKRFKYDLKNRKTGEYYCSEKDTVYAYNEYKFNKDDLLEKQFYTMVGSKKDNIVTEYFYNEDRTIRKVIYKTYNKTHTLEFRYKYDHQNNWIEQLKIIDGKLLYQRRRQITYYL